MRVLADNTSMHSVLRCLHPPARDESDALGILQLATQLVFCDTILVGSYEMGEVAGRTKQLYTEIASLGLPRDAIQQVECVKSEWISGCLASAEDFAEDFAEIFPTDATKLIGAVTPDFMDSTAIPDGDVHALISRDRSRVELGDIAAAALERRAAGMVEYVLAACPDLWSVVRRAFVQRRGWSPQVTACLAVLLRVYRNSSLAKSIGVHYSPAVARSRLLRRSGALAHERLLELVADTASALARRQIHAPSVARLLLRRSRGEPRAVLSEALRLRDRARPLRKIITAATTEAIDGSDDAAYRLEQRLREISHTVSADLGISPRPTLYDALELSFVLGIPSLRISAKGIVRWFRHRWTRRKVTILTDLSKAAAFGGDLQREFNRLARNVLHS